MARRRMIDPEFFLDEEVAGLEPYARLLYIGIWTLCDDNYATLPNRPEWIKAQIFPYDNINVVPLLESLIKSKKLIPFEDEESGKKYLFVANFFKYQKVDRPSLPKFPRYPRDGLDEYSMSPRSQVKLSKEKLSKEKLKELLSTFEEFWSEYPKKQGKKVAWKAWQKLEPSPELAEEITRAVKRQRRTSQWLKEGGQYVPMPATFLNQERWKDEVDDSRKKKIEL